MELPLRKHRKRRGWTLTHLTRITGIAANDLSMLERGLRPAFPGWRRRIVAAFGLTEDELFRVADEASGDAA
jgi:transcriptional regulator with XRE-family HTH domain